jgi:hypothetical protein
VSGLGGGALVVESEEAGEDFVAGEVGGEGGLVEDKGGASAKPG